MKKLLICLALTGCAAVGPDYTKPVPVAPATLSDWHGGSSELLDPALRGSGAQSYARFDDAVLHMLQARALEANHDIRSAALHFAQSRAQRSVAGSEQGPSVNARAGATRQRTSENGTATRLLNVIAPANRDMLIDTLSDPFSVYSAAFDASWELDLWGRVRRSVEAADAQMADASSVLRDVQLAVAVEVARNYYEVRAAQRQQALLRADVAAAGELLELVQMRYRGGLASELDVERQQTMLADLRSRLPGVAEQEAQAVNQLTLLLGATPGALQRELGVLPAADDVRGVAAGTAGDAGIVAGGAAADAGRVAAGAADGAAGVASAAAGGAGSVAGGAADGAAGLASAAAGGAGGVAGAAAGGAGGLAWAGGAGGLTGAAAGGAAAGAAASGGAGTAALDAPFGHTPDLALGITSDVVARRPDIQSAEARLHAATARIGVARADLYPRITLGLSLGLESLTGGKFGDWGSRQWTLGPSLSLPLFDNGRRRATVELRELEQQEAAINYQKTVLKAWHEVDDALNSYTAERQRQQQLKTKEDSSRNALQLSLTRYRQGLSDALPVLEAQRNLIAAQRERIQGEAMLTLKMLAICKAAGLTPQS